jgi:hypothetical protein
MQLKRDMKFGTWNVRNLYRSGSFTAAARELARYKLDLVGLQEVRWDKGSALGGGGGILIFYMENETKIISWEHDLLNHRIVSAVKRVEFVIDRMP